MVIISSILSMESRFMCYVTLESLIAVFPKKKGFSFASAVCCPILTLVISL